MTTKELSRRQARYLDTLSEFNFQVVFRPGKRNEKADALTRMPGSTPTDKDDPRLQQQRQVILTPDRVNISCASVGEATFKKIVVANKTDAVCTEFRDPIAAAKETLHIVRLATCRTVDGVLFKEGLLWVPEELRTDLLKEIHDQCSTNHPG